MMMHFNATCDTPHFIKSPNARSLKKHKHYILIISLLWAAVLPGNNLAPNGTMVYEDNMLHITFIREVPVLCYHNINKNAEKEDDYRISAFHFEQQMKALYDSGYHTILPDQLYGYLTKGISLPSKPVMLTFDDTHETHFSIAAAVLEKYGFKGVFFIMTVCIGKKNYLTAQQIKMLADRGHAIECHTYDHPLVKKITGEQWEQQINNPVKKLERITGKRVKYFAYPFGVWSDSAIIELKKRGIKAAFQLTGKKSTCEPLYTIKRMLIPGSWSEKHFLKEMQGMSLRFNTPDHLSPLWK